MKTVVLFLLFAAACAPDIESAPEPDTYTVRQKSAVLSTTARATAYAQCDAGDIAIDGWCRVRGRDAYVVGDGSFDDDAAPVGYVCSAYAPNRGTLIAEVECEARDAGQ